MTRITDKPTEEEAEQIGVQTTLPLCKRRVLLNVPSEILKFLELDKGDSVTWIKQREKTEDGIRNVVKLVKR